jgi:serine/threonine protein kinase
MNYTIDETTEVLGSGSFGKVFLTHNKLNKDHFVAIKVLNLVKLEDSLEAIEEECKILANLDHPNIVKYYETYLDKKYMYIVMEYIGGGELFELISK